MRLHPDEYADLRTMPQPRQSGPEWIVAFIAFMTVVICAQVAVYGYEVLTKDAVPAACAQYGAEIVACAEGL